MVGLAPGQLVLECSVEAEPAPEIEWHRDGILLQVGAGWGPGDTTFCAAQALDPAAWILGAEGWPPLSWSCTPLITVVPIFWMGTLRQGWDLHPGF